MPGTEFLDAETGRQKSSRKSVNACRDQNPRDEWPEMPAETPYLASYRKRAVCGDWMVVCVVRYEPVSDCNSLIRAALQGIFRKTRTFAQECSLIPRHFKRFWVKSLEKLAGNFFRLVGK